MNNAQPESEIFTILVAEDDPFIRKVFTMNLVDKQWNVQFAIHGQDAIEHIQKQTPHLLLLDLLMPIKNGFEVLQFVREQHYTFPVFILSNVSQEIDKATAKQLGATDYFIKSDLDIDDLTRTIRTTLSEHY